MTETATKRKSPDDQPQGEQIAKRAKLDTYNLPDPGEVQEVQEPEDTEQVAKPDSPPVKPAVKRPKIKKLTPPRPFPTVPTSASATGPRSAHSEGKNCICITRKTPLGAYLRRCKDVILEDGYKSLHLSAMGAAIPICLTLAASLPDILPHSPSQIKTEIVTGTVQVRDEIIPEGDDEDISYSNRSKSTVSVTLIIGDGVNETRPAKRYPIDGKRQRRKKDQKRKEEIVMSEPDQEAV
ncbi:hypothetical protein BJ322DRAFT_997906 [Thelephora terrestris]|uniref:Uncharacterized protein n=1 Tax=Thelephora terrestris TaxID=56493 RepID=A0A9P6HPG3_9AGAM|nr:hypothetical protein BJ322DRAFT_997906 [Thelephora terrestris]